MAESWIVRMTPQPWPLMAITQNRNRYLVLGWTSAGIPVVVPYGARSDSPVGAEPGVLTEPVRYALPGLNVSVEGEVSASVDGTVNASVTGPSLSDAVKIVNVDY